MDANQGWVDYSLCEKTFSLSRDGTNFVGDVAHNTKKQCNEVMMPESTYDDLRLGAGAGATGPRKVGTEHTYCIVAASTIGAGAKPYTSKEICVDKFKVKFEVQIVGKMVTVRSITPF